VIRDLRVAGRAEQDRVLVAQRLQAVRRRHFAVGAVLLSGPEIAASLRAQWQLALAGARVYVGGAQWCGREMTLQRDESVVAAIEQQLQARDRELAHALAAQAATSEILRVIAQSPADAQPVFDAIAAAARRLCNSRSANVFTFDGRLIHAAALTITDPNGLAAVRKAFPRPPGRDLAAPRAILTRAVVEIRDVLEDPDFLERQVAAAANFRSVLAVPLMHNGAALGAIAIGRPEPGPFPPQQVELLRPSLTRP
jgi:GAF domain-containing protein